MGEGADVQKEQTLRRMLSKLCRLPGRGKENDVAEKDYWRPAVGDLAKIEGTGRRWTGKQFIASVVDVRQEDNSVKVRFDDGGFKRYPMKEFLSIGAKQTSISERWAVGQHVYVAGTSHWYAGQTYRAVIEDIRDSDATVKVRYADGGYKRFNLERFEEVVSQHPKPPEMWDEEWQVQFSDDEASELSKLHDQIIFAARNNDTDALADLKARYQTLSRAHVDLVELRQQLNSAVDKGDYLEAHRLQQQLKAVAASGRTPSQSSTAAAVKDERGNPVPAIVGYDSILEYCMKRAVGSGLAGWAAMVLQVGSMMWLRTTMNYQYKHGMGMFQAFRALYGQGGIPRFYFGIGPAMLQGPMIRFGDTFANAGVLALFELTDAKDWPIYVKTVFASIAAGIVRVGFIPVDTVKTVMQVEGRQGLPRLMGKVRVGGVRVLFRGAMAWSVATFVGHYPWFTAFNVLNQRLPNYNERSKQILRNAGIGFFASVCSDTVSNSLRVLKTVRQTSDGQAESYAGIVKSVVKKDGVLNFLGRGLGTRIVANGCSGVCFSVLYKMFEEKLLAESFSR